MNSNPGYKNPDPLQRKRPFRYMGATLSVLVYRLPWVIGILIPGLSKETFYKETGTRKVGPAGNAAGFLGFLHVLTWLEFIRIGDF